MEEADKVTIVPGASPDDFDWRTVTVESDNMIYEGTYLTPHWNLITLEFLIDVVKGKYPLQRILHCHEWKVYERTA